ncbi:MAG: glycosyltransferase family 39 protein [Gammaproteobacteria bacterium]|nr:glycosyltransferase family 39 protein [Gammaproteobacteria bacterium]
MNDDSAYLLRLRIFLWLSIALSFFFNLSAVPLFDVDEGAFSEATREMFERGDFISPYLNGAPRFDKPILIYWLQAGSVALFGFEPFAFRLPSALAASLWVLAVSAFVRKVRSAQLGYYAGIVTALCLAVSVIGKAATADALLNLFIVVSMFAIYLYYKERRTAYVFIAFAAMGLGFLTKGPIAVLVPGVVSVLFFAVRGEWRAWLKAVTHPGGILLFVAIALPWYVLQYQKEGQAFIEGFFFHHNVDRFQGSMEQHGGSLFYYVPVVLFAALPFSAVFFKVALRWREMLRDDLMLYCLMWFGFVFVFFSLSGTKLPHYMNYGLTGLIVLITLYLPELKSRWLTLIPVVLLLVLLLALPQILTYGAQHSSDVYLRELLIAAPDYFGNVYKGVLVLFIVLTAYLMLTQRFNPAHKLFAAGVFAVVAISGLLLPVLGEILQRPIQEAALLARKENYTVVMWHVDAPSFSVYAQRPTLKRAPHAGDVVLTKKKYLGELPGHEVLYSKNGIALVKFPG